MVFFLCEFVFFFNDTATTEIYSLSLHDALPISWHWRVGRALLEQEIWMPAGQDATFVQYRLLEGPTSAQISLRPLCTSRHFHHLTRYQDMGPPTVNEKETALEFH